MFNEKRLSDATTNLTSRFKPEIGTGIFQVNLAFGYFQSLSLLNLETSGVIAWYPSTFKIFHAAVSRPLTNTRHFADSDVDKAQENTLLHCKWCKLQYLLSFLSHFMHQIGLEWWYLREKSLLELNDILAFVK